NDCQNYLENPQVRKYVFAYGNAKAVETIMRSEDDFMKKLNGGALPLHIAIIHSNAAAIKKLMPYVNAANVNFADDNGGTFLHYAAAYYTYSGGIDDWDLTRQLLEKGADI